MGLRQLVRVRPRFGVRMRSALAAAAVVAVASALSGAALLVITRQILLDNVSTAAQDRAVQVTTAVRDTDPGTLTAVLRPGPRERTIVQVLDQSGRVITASEVIAGAPPMSPLRPAAGRRSAETRRLAEAHDDPFHIVAQGVSTAAGRRTVLVGESLDTVDDGTEAVVAALLAGFPVLAVVVGAATFFFVGRTLQPVEAMRRQAATITSRNLHMRLPVPAVDDEVAALAQTMNTMLDRIETASAAQRRFVADASHELRSPLATIRANVDLLETAGPAEQTARPVHRIHAESARMARLIEDLLLLARADDHGLRLRHEDVDLDDLVYAERERIALQHPDLRVDGDVSPVRVRGDADALQRALRNLVDNAMRHAREQVTIGLGAGGAEAEMVVANDGEPIAAADSVRIFDRFVRLDDSRSRTAGGAGLGLPIAHEIVAAHGGTLTADDRTEGAAMRVRLPFESDSSNSQEAAATVHP
ncbi:sensor histidine kinase [Krasilnikovia sp. MM14-A1259]|uniref:sensor histidine kinase n=1 Tax=Krasilnikovia sp. MM14-A1259 TaxID=3373539 RepID=UPI003806F68B